MSEVYKGIKSILTAYWTKVKNYIDTKLSGKANSSHTHTKSQITDFPTSLPANGGTADKTVNDITITIPHKTEHTRYVILLGKIPAPTSTDNNSPYNWDVCGLIDVIRPLGHNVGHIRFSTGHGYAHFWKTYVDCDYLGYTAPGGNSSPLDIKCFQYGGEWWLGVQMTLGNGGYYCNAHITYKRNAPEEFLTAIPYYANYDGETVYNEEINSSIQDVPPDWLVTRTWQNGIKAPTFIGKLSGNAATATNATNDGNGNNIVNTYMPKSGGTFTGTVKCSGSLIIPTSTPSQTDDGIIWIS